MRLVKILLMKFLQREALQAENIMIPVLKTVMVNERGVKASGRNLMIH